MRRRCPTGVDLAQAFEGSARPEVMARLEDHLAACASCRGEWKAMSGVSALADELAPIPMRDPDRVRRAILGSATSPDPRLRWRGVLAPAGAFAIVAAVVIHVAGGSYDLDPPADARALARIQVERPARFHQTRIFGDGGHRETVHLDDGRMRFDVEKLRPGERFVVEVGSAEVEVRGTAFDVDARNGELVEVVVHEGVVAVRARGGESILRAGDRWPLAEEPPAQPKPTPPEHARGASSEAKSARGEPKDVVERTPAPRPALGTSGEERFDRGWRALKAGDHRAAAELFANERGPFEEDAAFWRAVALERAGSRDEAIAAFEAFLAEHPASERRGEASVMLGWLELDGGRPEIARRLFEAGRDDPKPDVRSGARSGLEALGAGAESPAPRR
jgi:TolA-binding protein